MHPDLIAAAELLANGVFDEETMAQEGPSLSDCLYAWYLNSSSLPLETGPLLPHELGLPAVLRCAHHDAGRFEGGWRAETVSTWGRAVARKGDLSRVLDRSEYSVPARRGLRAQPQDALFVSRCWDWVDEETGFWHLRRGEWTPPGAPRLVRLYWNCAPAQTAQILKVLTSILASDQSEPYMFKTPASPDRVGRADALVLYLGVAGFEAFEHAFRGAAETLRPALNASTPRMTLRLAPGVAMAEGALDGTSFGDSRCRLIGQAFDAAGKEVRRSPERLAFTLADAFVAAGLDPARPYLEPRP
jgi:hypothetical protein